MIIVGVSTYYGGGSDAIATINNEWEYSDNSAITWPDGTPITWI